MRFFRNAVFVGSYLILGFAWTVRITIIALVAFISLCFLASILDKSDKIDDFGNTQSEPQIASTAPQSNDLVPPIQLSTIESASSVSTSSPQAYLYQKNGFEPRVPLETLVDVGSATYKSVIEGKLTSVSGYYRGSNYVVAHNRQPPGGLTFNDHKDAALAAVGVAALIYSVDWLRYKCDEWSANQKNHPPIQTKDSQIIIDNIKARIRVADKK